MGPLIPDPRELNYLTVVEEPVGLSWEAKEDPGSKMEALFLFKSGTYLGEHKITNNLIRQSSL